MGQTKSLSLTSVVPISASLCRLSSVPAGRWSFPTLSLQVLLWLPGPLPRWAPMVLYPVTSHRNIGLPCARQIGFPTTPRTATSVRPNFSELQSFLYVQAPRFAHHPGRSHHNPEWTGQPWLLLPNNSRFVTSPCPGYASRPNRAIDDRGLSPHQTCSLVGCPRAA